MITATATLRSVSPFQYSRFHNTPKLEKEGPNDYEERTWIERAHVSNDGKCFIPPMAFKNCLSEAAKFLGVQIPGKGKSNYTKHFEAGVLVVDPLVLPVTKAELAQCGLWLHVPSDGRRGGTKRVMKCFPVIREWSGDVTFLIFDEVIKEDVFKYHLEQAGKFIGIGAFRPRNNGYFGRFAVEKVLWSA
jgi:hypothetical protein